MYQVTATITQDERQTAREIKLAIENVQAGKGVFEWLGFIDDEHVTGLEMGEIYHMVTTDGRTGDFKLGWTSTTTAVMNGPWVSRTAIVGIGPLIHSQAEPKK